MVTQNVDENSRPPGLNSEIFHLDTSMVAISIILTFRTMKQGSK